MSAASPPRTKGIRKFRSTANKIVKTQRVANAFIDSVDSPLRMTRAERKILDTQVSIEKPSLSKLQRSLSDEDLRAGGVPDVFIDCMHGFREMAFQQMIEPLKAVEAFFTQPLEPCAKAAFDDVVQDLDAQLRQVDVVGEDLRRFCFAKAAAISSTWKTPLKQALHGPGDKRDLLADKLTQVYAVWSALCDKAGELTLHDLFDLAAALNGGTRIDLRRADVGIAGTRGVGRLDFLPAVHVAKALKVVLRYVSGWRAGTLCVGMHSLEFAARLHIALVSIHPFTDGNGRTIVYFSLAAALGGPGTMTAHPAFLMREIAFGRFFGATSPSKEGKPQSIAWRPAHKAFLAQRLHSGMDAIATYLIAARRSTREIRDSLLFVDRPRALPGLPTGGSKGNLMDEVTFDMHDAWDWMAPKAQSGKRKTRASPADCPPAKTRRSA